MPKKRRSGAEKRSAKGALARVAEGPVLPASWQRLHLPHIPAVKMRAGTGRAFLRQNSLKKEPTGSKKRSALFWWDRETYCQIVAADGIKGPEMQV